MKRGWIGIVVSFAGLCFGAAPELVYRCTFDTPAALDAWTMEGPGVARIENGQLLIYSKWQPELEAISNQVALIEPGGQNYYPFLESWVKAREPEMLPKYCLDRAVGSTKAGTFMGGHLQFWNKTPHPDNFLIRIKLKALSPYPLHMLTVCARGLQGESVFDRALEPRYGLEYQYLQNDLANYRVSFWSGLRKSCAMRRAPGRVLVAEQPVDLPADVQQRFVQLELLRWNGRLVFRCDGQTLLEYTDPKPLSGGWFSIRLMAAAKGLYDDYEVYALTEDPFSGTGKGTRIAMRSSPQKDFPTADQVVDGQFIVIGDREPRGSVYRDVLNTCQGLPVYRFEASADANRIEFGTCFASPSVVLSAEEKAELSALGDADAVCDLGHYGDTITYEWNARFPEPLTKESQGIFAQWHGRPDRTLVTTPSGETKKLAPQEFLNLLKTMRFDNDRGNIGIDLKTGQPNGWRCDGSSGGPIGSFHILDGTMCLMVRNDPAAVSDNTVKVKPKPGRETAQKGNKTGALVFSQPLDKVPINQWMHFKVQIKYSTYRFDSDKALTPGFVKVWIDGNQVADWKGDIGKNDELGPYFKYGIYKPGPGGFKVDCAGFSQIIEEKH
ncbi:MAG TPA: DUF1961 family protein [Pontiellaceae bacterium]|nr:DUF1961 family protein [Pontiellaceae bacterium]